MPIEAVTFDFHNTLAHCDRWFQHEVRTLVPAVLAHQARDIGIVVDNALMDRAIAAYRALRMEIIEHGDELDATACVCHVLGKLDLPVDPAAVALSIDSIMRDCLADSQPVPGAVDTVQRLAASGLRLGVISAAVHHSFLLWSLERFGILDAFDVVVTSASAGFYKTRAELYLHTLEQLNVEPGRSVHVGDSHRFDVEGARRAGMQTVWFATNGADLTQSVADLTVTEINGLAPRLLTHFGIRTR